MSDPRKPASDGHDAAPHDDRAWLERTREALDESARDLDAATLSRLNRARQAALAELPRARGAHPHWPFVFAGVAALALVATLAGWPPLRVPDALPPAQVSAEEIELLAADDSLELYEDLEFYAWLDAQEAAVTDG